MITAAITFGREASGVRIVSAPITGALISGVAAPKIASARTSTATGALHRQRPEREHAGDERDRRERERGDTRDQAVMAAITPTIAPALVAAMSTPATREL